ncbi:hypothetical protein BDW75DRAFT_208427 [Aspergillus navahoensis]
MRSRTAQDQKQDTISNPSIPKQHPTPGTRRPATKSTRSPLLPVIQIPRVPTHHEGLVFFLSTALLKSHRRVIQCLEGVEHSPNSYRDYNSPRSRPRSQDNAPSPLPGEADIIVSPQTGILLTISQATMQLYLPGHKPGFNTCKSIVKSINSPLHESIFRLASRYAQLYVFIAHNSDQSTHSKSHISNPQLTVDKHLNSSLISVTAFCTSISEHSRVIPLLVPSIPEIISTWILALAHKHICLLPPPLTAESQLQYRIVFAPVNPNPQLGGLLGRCRKVFESRF